MVTLRDIVAGLGVAVSEAALLPDLQIAHIRHDSREVQPGDLFVARRGEAADGHAFIPDAVAQGAVAVIAEREVHINKPIWVVDCRQALMPTHALQPPAPASVIYILVANSHAALEQVAAWWRSRLPVEVIGVTGSVGKTSTKELIAAVLGRRYVVLKSVRSLNTDVGMALTLLQLTPAHQKAVLEMGMYAKGEIAHLCQMSSPRIGVVTNVGPTHLERLGTIAAIAEAKSELVRALPGDGLAILNGDDPLVMAMAAYTRARVFTYGLTPGLDLWASDTESHGLEGILFRLHCGDETLHVRVPLLGMHSVQTALAASAVGLACGLSWDDIIAGMSKVPEQLRLIVTPGLNGAMIVDDTYNASPSSTLAALNLLAELEGRRIAVLGDMLELGSYEQDGHRLVGARAKEVADVLVVVGPRGRIMGHEARSLGMPADAVFFADTNEQAVGILKTILQRGDVVLVKGSRGMTMEQIVEKIR